MNALLSRSLPVLFCTLCVTAALSQSQPSPAAAAPDTPTSEHDRTLPAESAYTTNGQITIKGKVIPYKVTVGTQPVWNAEGKRIASLFYTYYERSDITDKSKRPFLMSFNGGPGSASVWMHVAYTGPKILNIDAEGFPVQPYGVKDNPNSILDVADIVYVDPVNTGFSRILDPKTERSTFFGVNADIKYLAGWLDVFISRHNRWLSPKYLIGESYGTTRVSGLALEMQDTHWTYLNGVILVSPTELGLKRDGPVGDALSLPYYTAAAWYHKALPPDLQQKDLDQILPDAEAFTLNELIPALAKGSYLEESKRKEIAAKVARYSGLTEQSVLGNNLAIPTQYFWKDLLRDKGYTIGRLDSRYLGIDKKLAGNEPDYNSELTSWLHAFTPAINYYLRDVLKFKTDLLYNMFGDVHPWDNANDRTGENLRQAMAQNPYLHVMVQSGYYDGATTYFDAKYSLWQLDPGGKMKDRLRFEGYRGGHMMYLRAEDLINSNEHIRDFIKKSTPAQGQSAKY